MKQNIRRTIYPNTCSGIPYRVGHTDVESIQSHARVYGELSRLYWCALCRKEHHSPQDIV